MLNYYVNISIMKQQLKNTSYPSSVFMMKILKPILCFFILALCSIMPFAISEAIGREGTAIVIKSQDITAYNAVAEGFERYGQNDTITIKAVYNLKGDIEEGKRVIHHIAEIKPKPDVILTIGTLATTFAKKHIDNTPIIFCAVINHELLDLRGTNIYGVSSSVSIEKQFAILSRILHGRKNVGILYDPVKTERIVSELTSLGSKYGYNVITKKVSSKNDVEEALKAIIKKIDVLWVVPDDTVISRESINMFSEVSRKNHLPIFCTSGALVREGALISLSPNYSLMGGQAAEIAKRLIENPLQNPPHIEEPENLTLTINTKTAEMQKVDISQFLSLPNVVLCR